ncbi:ECF transporter S component [Bifidobacterium pullorum]|uniref:ECF transporter S component n=1 Tax=Bifidobacterium pullorum TaxID=78448 RepID=UPI003AB1E563
MVDRTDSSTDNIITTTEPSPIGQSSKPENRRWRWTAADIAVGAALGVACGLVFWGFNFAYAWLSPLIGGILPGLASVLHPLWYFSGTLAVIILRKPGAAIYVNLVGTAAEMLLGNQFSVGFVFASAAMQGLFAEIPFMVTRYRVYNLPISVVSGALVALEYGVYLMLFRYQGVAFLSARGIVHMVSELVGGVLIAGVMSWYLYRAIAATGALDRFASGRAARRTES